MTLIIPLSKRVPYIFSVSYTHLLKMHYSSLDDVDFKIVKTGETLDLGGKQLVFLEAQMLHWPDSMFTLLLEDGILFSNDAFGQHLCLKDRYDSDIPENVLMDAAAKFYANLLTPLSGLVLNKFKQVTSLELLDKITMIAPSHGMIWTDPMKIIDAYTRWATGKCEDKVTIVYLSLIHIFSILSFFTRSLISRILQV